MCRLGQKKNVVFPVTRPTLIFGPDPKAFIKIFLFSTNPALCYLYVRQDWVIRCVV